jgi:cell wall-associated NlpC family hydrolase
VTGATGLQSSIDALTRAMTSSSSSWMRVLGTLARGASGSATAGAGGGHGPGASTFGMSPSAQAQWQYRIDQQIRMHSTGMQDAQNAHVTARAAAQRAHGLARARWDNQQTTYATQLAARRITPDRVDAINRRAAISDLQYRASTDLHGQRIAAADTTFSRSRDQLNAQRDRLQLQYQAAQDRAAGTGGAAGLRQSARQQALAQRNQSRMIRGIASAGSGAVAGMAGRFSSGIRDFNSGVDQYGRMVSLYGGFGGRGFSALGYGNRASNATRQGFDSGLNNVARSDSDLFTGMSALYRQNSFANLPTMQRSAAATALVSPEMGVAGAAQLQSQMGTARAYYAGQMFGLAPSIQSGGAKSSPQQTFSSLFSQVSSKDLGKLSPTQMKAMLAQGGSLQTTLENYASAAGIGTEGVQAGADYLTLSNRLRSKYKKMDQGDVDKLLANAAMSGKAGDKARGTLKDAAPGVGESYIDAQRRAEGAKREGKLDSSASYITAAISTANTLIDIRELIKPVMAPLRMFLGMFSGAMNAGGPLGVAAQVASSIPGAGVAKAGAKWLGSSISGLFGGADGPPKSTQSGKVTQPTASALGSGANAAGAISFAQQQLGEPYVFGAEGPDSWDCSSLMQAAYRSIGVNIPRTTYQQINVGKDVPVKDAQPGDLLFYPDGSHVVMAIGGGKVIQAPHTGDVVKISPLIPSQYGRAKRIVGSVGTLSNSQSSASKSKSGVASTSTAAVSGGRYGSTEEVDALAAALAGGGGGGAQQITSTGLAPSTQNTDSKSAGAPAGPSDPKGNAALGKQLAAQLYGWTGGEWDALYQLWQHESGWNEKALNPSSAAAGIPQALPGSKMSSSGPDWRTNASTQIKWGLKYIKGRYGDPEKAWDFWQHPTGSPAGSSTHWYRDGAWEIPGDQDARLHAGEMVLERNTARTVRQALLKDSLRATDPTTGAAPGGTGAVHLNFDAGSIVISMGAGTSGSGARQAATQFVDYVTADGRVRKLMGGY